MIRLAQWQIHLGKNVEQEDALIGDRLFLVRELNGLLRQLGKVGNRQLDRACAQPAHRHNRLSRAKNRRRQSRERRKNESGNPHLSILPQIRGGVNATASKQDRSNALAQADELAGIML